MTSIPEHALSYPPRERMPALLVLRAVSITWRLECALDRSFDQLRCQWEGKRLMRVETGCKCGRQRRHLSGRQQLQQPCAVSWRVMLH